MAQKYKNFYLVIIAAIAGGMFCNHVRNLILGVIMLVPTLELLPDALFVVAFALLIIVTLMYTMSQERAANILLILAIATVLVGGITALVQTLA